MNNKRVFPELRSIPLTFIDCSHRKLWVGIFGTSRFFCDHPYRNIPIDYCDDCRNRYDYCPEGFR